MLCLRQWPPWFCALSLALLCSAILMFCSTQVLAQATPVKPDSVRRMFGVGDKEFFKGAWIKIRPDSAGTHPTIVDQHWRQVWELADSLGIDILRIQAYDFDSFDLAKRMIWARTDTVSPRQRLIASHVIRRIIGDSTQNDFTKASVGREVRFYPFTGRDSVEYRLWPSKFLTLAGGTTERSPQGEEVDVYDQRAHEQHYRKNAMSGPTVIARDIVFDHFPAQRLAWPIYDGFGVLIDSPFTWQNRHAFLAGDFQFNTNSNHQFVVVTGHLFDVGSSTPDTARILEVKVTYEIPRGQKFIVYDPADSSKTLVTAAGDIVRTLATLVVRKEDLMPEGSPPNFNAYREAALKFDAAWCEDSVNGLRNTGPLFRGNESRRINLKVTWIGNEDLAIRSIALRDATGQLMLGVSGADTTGQYAFLQSALRDARRGVYLNNLATLDSAWPVIAHSGFVESVPWHSAAHNRLQRLVHDSVRSFDPVHTDTSGLPVWNETVTDEALFQRRLEQSNPRFRVPDAVVTEIIITPFLFLDHRLKLKNGKVPSIARHNGGRFTIPLLNFSTSQAGRDSIEHYYESTLQLLGFRQHIPQRGDEDVERYLHLPVGRSAAVARDSRRRLIVVPFCVSRMTINYNDFTDRPERGTHTMVHIQEPSEMRTMMNIGLCYGARGVLWQIIEGQYNFMAPRDTARDSNNVPFRHGYMDDFGVHHPLAKGPNLNVFTPFKFIGSVGTYGYDDTTSYATIDTFFTGWNIRSKAMTDIHRWIDQVGPSLVNLGWRDGYSIHFTVQQPNDTTLPFRPLANDIVTQVRSRRPGSMVRDSAHRTFVELGLFYKTNPSDTTLSPDPRQDVHHIFVVNRRCFERTDDILATSDTGRVLDTLAETREITVHLKLPKHDSTQYNFLRIREIAADTARLPLANGPRTPLDTIVYADSAVSITLGPGRAALLRITYLPPDESIVNGRTAFNSQRKMLWDGNRHHTAYMRYDTTLNDTCIYYRRSLPVTDTTGAILWEPFEFNVSTLIGQGGPDTARTRNGYPSLTMRTTGEDSVISIIWTCHPAQSGHSSDREIVVRDVGYLLKETTSLGQPIYFSAQFSPIRHIDWYKGSDATAWRWGTPGINSEKGGDILIWSDSLTGIMGRVRSVSYGGNLAYYWQTAANYVLSPALSISGQLTTGPKYPSVPPFARVASTDSSTLVVWEHPYQFPYGPNDNHILLERVVHVTSGGSPVLIANQGQVITPSAGRHHHPSIDFDQTNTVGGRR